MFADAAERRIALKLAEGLDEAGYCRLEAPAVAEACSVGLDVVEAGWTRLRQIEPAGLFAGPRRGGLQRGPRRGRGGVDQAAPDRACRLVRAHRRRVPGRPACRAQSPRSRD